MRHIEYTVEVDVEDVFPIFYYRLGGAEHAVAPGDAGIVDQDRDRPDLVGDLCCGGNAVVALGHVERKTFRFSAGTAGFLRRLGGPLLIDVEHHPPRALPRIARRDRPSD